MFYPLEAIFADRNIYFAGHKDMLCSYLCSLLEFYEPGKTEQCLEAPYFSILAGLDAVRQDRDVESALPKACEAIIATLDILKGIKPFDYIDRNEIRSAFSASNISLARSIISDKAAGIDPDFIHTSSIADYAPANVRQLHAAEAVEKLYGLMTFYSRLFDELPKLYETIWTIADRYSHCDKHDSDLLFGLAFLELRLEGSVQTNVTYTPYLTAENVGRFAPGKMVQFKSYRELIITELFESLMVGHYPRLCLICKKPFLKTDKNIQKYCTGLSPYYSKGKNKKQLSCQQYAKQYGVPEKAGDNPYKVVHKKRTDCIRTEKNRGTITPVFAEAARLLAGNHLCSAMSDPDYTFSQYEKDMEKDNLYKETAKYLRTTSKVNV